ETSRKVGRAFKARPTFLRPAPESGLFLIRDAPTEEQLVPVEVERLQAKPRDGRQQRRSRDHREIFAKSRELWRQRPKQGVDQACFEKGVIERCAAFHQEAAHAVLAGENF